MIRRTHQGVAISIAALVLAMLILALVEARKAEAAFSGQDGNIVFQRDGNIWLIGPNGISSPFNSLTANLTPNTPSSQEVDPAMSRNGRKVAFASDRDGDFEIFTLDIYTGRLTKVTNNSRRDAQPAWSPDGSRIAYESLNAAAGGEVDIFSKASDGAGTALLEFNLAGDQYTPSWSPDGNRIAFYDALADDVWVYDRVFSVFDQITINGNDSHDLLPNWAPSGNRIVFQSNRSTSDGSTDFEIYTIRLDRSGLRQLTNNDYDDGDAAYAPDGTRIVHNQFISGGASIASRNSSDGFDGQTLSGFATEDVAPDWGVAVPPPPGCSVGGTFARDVFTGTDSAETVCSLSGNDYVNTLGGSDTLKGGTGADELVGAVGRDTFLGSGGNDTLDSRDGVNGNDFLNGGAGNDRCLKDAREASVRNCS